MKSDTSATFIGVIGAGSFGLAISNLLAHKNDVLLYTRSESKEVLVNKNRTLKGVKVSDRVQLTSSLKDLCQRCNLIYPIVPSAHFRSTMKDCSEYLTPAHILIHGIKGLDINVKNLTETSLDEISKSNVRRMSEVIKEETLVRRVGCLSGPNLANEIHEGQPTATVLASEFEEVINIGVQTLSSRKFFVFGSPDIIGAELAGSFKNIIALGSGMIDGMGMGKNLQGLLITRALREIIYLGRELGATNKAFLGTGGIGDIVATSLSNKSRNFKAGFAHSQGKSIDEIVFEMDEVAEGLRTIKIAYALSLKYNLQLPIIKAIYMTLYEGLELKRGLQRLMMFPFAKDVDFL